MKKLVVVSLLLSLSMLLQSCAYPSKEEITVRFLQDQEAYSSIADYLLSLEEFDTISISKFDGNFFSNLEYHVIEKDDVNQALQTINNHGCSSIQKNGKQVSFEMWYSSQDVGCGVCYSEEAMNKPEECVAEQFVTKVITLETPNWYYYVSDYNLWRVNQENGSSIDTKESLSPTK